MGVIPSWQRILQIYVCIPHVCGGDPELLDYFEGMTWAEIHQQLKVVRLVPETNFALVGKGQELNTIQYNLLANSDYQVAEY